jgi:hypothetical protein
MFEIAQKIFKSQFNDIRIEKGLISEGVNVASDLVKKGTEIIVTRGATAVAIKRSNLEVIVVEIPITCFDIIRAIEKAPCGALSKIKPSEFSNIKTMGQ